MKKRILSMLLAIMLVFLSVDTQVLAREAGEGDSSILLQTAGENVLPVTENEGGTSDKAQPTEMPETEAAQEPTQIPEVTAAPEQTTAPEQTMAPEKTAEPTPIQKPSETTEPGTAGEPTPLVTGSPAASIVPGSSASPEGTADPNASASPTATDGLEGSPSATPSLSPSVSPSATPSATPMVAAVEGRIYRQTRSGGDTSPVSRIDWLRTLIAQFDMTVESNNYPDNYYSDIDSSYEYYHEVMVATEFGLIDVEAGDALEADEPATREFAAHSLNVCLGYLPDNTSYTYEEAGSVSYPDDLQVAAEHYWFNLSGSSILPDQTITVAEMEVMMADADASIEATVIDPNYNNNYQFKENVIVLPQDTQAELTDENEITIYSCQTELKEGDLFALIYEDFPVVKKVVSTSTDGSALVIKTEDVATDEAFESIDIQGTMTADLSQAQVLDSNTVVSYIVGGTAENEWEDGTKYDSAEEVGGQQINTLEVTRTYDIPESVRAQFDLADGLKAVISCKVTNVDADFSATSSSAYVKVNAVATFSCNVSLDVLEALGIPSSITLAKVPVAYIGYMSVTLDLSLKGDVTLSLVEHISVGVSYSNARGFRLVTNFYKDAFTIQAKAQASAGCTASIGLNWYAISGVMYAKIGARTTIESEIFTDGNLPIQCTHVNAYMYASVGCSVSVNLVIYKDSWGKDKVIYDKANSPIKVSQHYEDGKPVAKCTREEEEYWGTGNKRWKYYSPADSRYSYNGASSGIGSNGETFTIFEYSLDENENATITKYNGNVSALNIPEQLDGYTVVEIGNSVFKGNTQLRMVIIPNSVTCIGNDAFSGCSNLSEVTLSDNLQELNQKAFYNCDSLESIKIPKSLESAGASAAYGGPFKSCDNLKTVIFEEGVTVIAGGLFESCTGLESIIIPDTVTTIGADAFLKCENLVSVTLSENLSEIKNAAFEKCTKLAAIKIPDSVTNIGNQAFSGCSNLAEVTLSANLQELNEKAFYNCDSLTSIKIPKSLESAGASAANGGPFKSCDNLKTVIFEEGVTVIAGGLFESCTGLESIIIPDTVTTIGADAFLKCENLVSVTLSENLSEIKNAAFEKCTKLAAIKIPDSVTNIGIQAFSGCSNLSEVTLSANLQELNQKAFYNCVSLTSIKIPKRLKSAGASSTYGGPFNSCDDLKTVIFEEGVTVIADGLFEGCTGLESIVIPDTVTTIGTCAFSDCSNLASVKLSQNLQSIEGKAFGNCKSLKEIELPNSITSMENYIFSGCTSLEKATLPNICENITEGTFQSCSSLKEIELPDSVTAVQKYAFDGASSLTRVTGGKNLTLIEQYAFRNCAALTDITLVSTVTTIGKYAFSNCDALAAITLPDSLTSLGSYAFSDCEVLADIQFGTGLTSIPTYAFYQCPSLEKVVLPYRIATVQGYAFANCTKLTEVTIPRATTSIADTTFSYPAKMTIYGISGTYAETFANDKGIKFVNQEVNATQVSLGETQLTINKGASTQLILTVEPADFTDAVKWKSSNTAVVTVDDAGTVKAVGIGSAKIAVSVGSVTASCTIEVVQPVTSIGLNKTSLSLNGGDTYQLTATVSPSSANNKEIGWTSSDETVATVSEDGLVTAWQKGSAVITAAAKDGSGKTRTCTVTVVSSTYTVDTIEDFQSQHPYENDCKDSWVYTIPGAEKLKVTFSEDTKVEEDFDFIYLFDEKGTQIGKYTGSELAGQTISAEGSVIRIQLVSDDATNDYGFRVTDIREEKPPVALQSISLDQEKLALAVGEMQQLTVICEPADATLNTEVEWTSSNAVVASVEKGVVTANGAGNAVITAQVDGKKASCTVSVHQPVEGIQVEPAQLELHVGETGSMTAVLLPQGVQPAESLLWQGYDETVISLTADRSGKQVQIKALKAGTTQIRVSIEGKEAVCDVTVLKSLVTLDYQNGQENGSIEVTVGQSMENLPVDLEWEGYLFAGWYTEPEGQGERVTAETVFKDQWKLYACWLPVVEGLYVRPVGDQEYTGKAIKPEIEVYDGAVLLQEKTDYTVSYKNNTKANDASNVKTAPTITVTGKGNYSGKETVTFRILPKDITEDDVTAADLTLKYNKKIQKPVPSLSWNGKKLKNKTDYTVEYPDLSVNADAYKEPGTYTILVKGKGNYTGEREVTFTVTEAILMSKASVSKIAAQPYTGSPITAETMSAVPVVKYGKTILTEGVHYTLSYEENVEIGTAAMILTGTEEETPEGTFAGEKRVTFKITGGALNKAKVTGIPKSLPYTGEELTAASASWGEDLILTMTVNKVAQTLTEGEDYTVTYQKNRDKGTATVIFTGINGYSGTLKKTFKITAYDISKDEAGKMEACLTEQPVYAKGGSRPEPEVRFDGVLLEAGKDYTLSYKNHTAVNDGSNPKKQPTVTIKGKGNYSGSLALIYTIVSQDIAEMELTAPDKVYSTKKNAYKSTPRLVDLDGKTLKAKTDYENVYTYSYGEDTELADGTKHLAGEEIGTADILPAGTLVQVTVTGKGNYHGTQTGEYRIVKSDIAKAKVTVPAQIYTGEAITLEEEQLTVKIGKEILTTEDFEIVEGSYKNNLKKGTATLTIRGLGDYGGTKTVKFTIKAKSMLWWWRN